jgi:hypothetical protein
MPLGTQQKNQPACSWPEPLALRLVPGAAESEGGAWGPPLAWLGLGPGCLGVLGGGRGERC